MWVKGRASEPNNQVLIHKNYLYWHEIKSLATLFYLEKIAKLSHEIETLFDQISKGNTTISESYIDWIRESVEYIKLQLQEKIYNQPTEQNYNKLINHNPPKTKESKPIKPKVAEKVFQKEPTKKKILIIEDEPINRKLLEACIQKIDKEIEIISVDSAEEGLFWFFK